MKDGILTTLIEFAEADEKIEHDVTLLVGGFLISGFITSWSKYMEHHPTLAKFKEILENHTSENLSETPDDSSGPDERDNNFIHLRDARCYTTNGNPVPGNQGVFFRIPVESVNGFCLGLLSADS